MEDKPIREAVGLFHDEQTLRDAADELMISGIDRANLSLLAAHGAVEKHLGHVYTRVQELEDDPKVAYQAYVGSDSRNEAKGLLIGGLFYVGAVAAAGIIVASGGTIAVLIAGTAAVGGAGGLIGAALARYLDSHHAQYLQEHLNDGGLLLWVRTDDEAHEARAVEILKRHSAEDVHVHELPPLRHIKEGGVSYDLSFMKRLGM